MSLKIIYLIFIQLKLFLLQDGVEIDLQDKNGKTPLMLAVGRKHDNIVAYLKKEAKFRNSILPRIDFW